MAKKLHMDIETVSDVEPKKVGSYVYRNHPSTKVLCVAYALDDGPVKVFRPAEGHTMRQDFYEAMKDPTVEKHAWNAGGFEALFFDWVPISQWRCTMIRAAYWGLPMKLEHAADALNTGWRKDMAGHRLMLQMSRKRKDGTYWHETDPEKYDRLCEYCKQDVEAERDVSRLLPELPESEQKLWELDFEMMRRGMPVDKTAVDALKDGAQRSLAQLNGRMSTLTKGAVNSVNAVGALLSWCHREMIDRGWDSAVAVNVLPSLDKETVAQVLRLGGLPAPVEKALLIRQEAAKSSVAKLDAMTNALSSDGTIKGLTQFYGASRTGRWAGRLVQVQNLPRPAKGVDPAKEIDAIKRIGPAYTPPEGKPALEVVSSCLRGCFKPAQGEFVVGDFSQIEARVIAWLAGQQDILDVFARGEDVYTYTANKLGSSDRQFGKVLVLACGFGMGWSKFKDTAKTYGIDLSDAAAKDAVTKWREANPRIPEYWKRLERVAREVISGARRSVHTVGHVRMAMGARKLDGCFLIGLPSGRHLVYRNARLVDEDRGYQPRIVYDGVNQTTRRWEAQDTYGGKLAENITQAVARDLLAAAVSRLEVNGVCTPLVTIHDEVVALSSLMPNNPDATKITVKAHMEVVPAWAKGLPIAADVKVMERYGK